MPDVVVVGAGITGSYTAWLLAQSGLDVTLVERAGIARQASANNPGGINPLHGPGIAGPMLSLAMHAYHLHRRHQAAVAALSGRQFHLRTITRLEIALSESEYAGLGPAYALYNNTEGFSAEWLDRAAALRVEPGLHPDIAGGLMLQGNCMVDAHQYTLALAEASVRCGARRMQGAVTGTGKVADRVTSVCIDGNELACGAAVFATGAWAGDIHDWLGVRVPIEPVKGELLQVRLRDRSLPHHITRGPAGLYSMANGDIMLGGTRERAGYDIEPSESGYRHIMAGTERLFPGVTGAIPVKKRAALRPSTPDSLPIVGRLPGWENAYVATGGGTKGMLMSAAMAGMITDLITGSQNDAPEEAVAACDPARFGT
jgi:glycine/D-amino acid oxidase-like deaminating enzyme